MKSALQLVASATIGETNTRFIPSTTNGTKLAAKKRKRHIANASKRRNRKR